MRQPLASRRFRPGGLRWPQCLCERNFDFFEILSVTLAIVIEDRWFESGRARRTAASEEVTMPGADDEIPVCLCQMPWLGAPRALALRPVASAPGVPVGCVVKEVGSR